MSCHLSCMICECSFCSRFPCLCFIVDMQLFLCFRFALFSLGNIGEGLISSVVVSGTLRHRWLPVNEVMLMKGHVTCYRSGRHYLIVMMFCTVLCNETWTWCNSKQSYIIALCYVRGDEQMIGWSMISYDGMKKKERHRERERLHEETGVKKGGNKKEGGVRDEGGKGREWWASESKVKSPLVWQLPACTLLFNWLSTSTPSLRLECCEVGCFTCDVEATTGWAHWSRCAFASVYSNRSFVCGFFSSSCHCWVDACKPTDCFLLQHNNLSPWIVNLQSRKYKNCYYMRSSLFILKTRRWRA